MKGIRPGRPVGTEPASDKGKRGEGTILKNFRRRGAFIDCYSPNGKKEPIVPFDAGKREIWHRGHSSAGRKREYPLKLRGGTGFFKADSP